MHTCLVASHIHIMHECTTEANIEPATKTGLHETPPQLEVAWISLLASPTPVYAFMIRM